MIDFNDIIVALAGSGALMSAAVYLIRRSFEQKLDLALTAHQEQVKAMIAEDSRRRTVIFDRQLPILITGVSLSYRIRNEVRDFRDFTQVHKSIESVDIAGLASSLNQLESLVQSLRSFLFDNRALMPSEPFEALHELKNELQTLEDFSAVLSFSPDRTDSPERDRAWAGVQDVSKEIFLQADRLYSDLLESVQTSFGVEG